MLDSSKHIAKSVFAERQRILHSDNGFSQTNVANGRGAGANTLFAHESSQKNVLDVAPAVDCRENVDAFLIDSVENPPRRDNDFSISGYVVLCQFRNNSSQFSMP